MMPSFALTEILATPLLHCPNQLVVQSVRFVTNSSHEHHCFHMPGD